MKRLFCLLAVLLLVGCATPEPTPTPDPCAIAAEWIGQWDALIARWDDANELAGSTPRMSLPGVIESLQVIKRDMAALDGACPEAARTRDATAEYMEAVIDAYLAFVAQEDDKDVAAKFNEADTAMQSALHHYSTLMAKVPTE